MTIWRGLREAEPTDSLVLGSEATAGGGDPSYRFKDPSQEWPELVRPSKDAIWRAPDCWRGGLDIEEDELAALFGRTRTKKTVGWVGQPRYEDATEIQLWALESKGEGESLLVEWLQCDYVHSGHGDSREIYARAWIQVSADRLPALRAFIAQRWAVEGPRKERVRLEEGKRTAYELFLEEMGEGSAAHTQRVEAALKAHQLDGRSVQQRRAAALLAVGLTEEQVGRARAELLCERGLDEESRRARLAELRREFEASYTIAS